MGGKRQVALYVTLQGRHMCTPHFSQRQHAMDMKNYANAELVDIHFNYGPADGNGRLLFDSMGKDIQ
ncbi:hypothetical protein TNCV_1601041 [Trichonephila clavipes]|nr:hypothetical protein TNCV_1601041 [Trichonephila clavipes]